MARLHLPRWLTWLAPPAILLLLVTAFWSWDWFIPFAERRASASIGRPLTIAHLHFRLGWIAVLTALGVRIANPPGFPADLPSAQAERLVARIDLPKSWRQGALVLPELDIAKPMVEATARGDRTVKYALDIAAPEPSQPPLLRIAADIMGTYADQPITGQALGDAMLALQARTPWPISLQLANGPTQVSLEGRLRDPLALQGADLRLVLRGPDMALLEKLTSVPIPRTPNYEVAGRLDYVEDRFRLNEIVSRVGQTDIDGTLTVATAGTRIGIEGALHSRRVDLADLGGFIGKEPGRVTPPGQTAEQRRAMARNEAGARMLPDEPINLPKLQSTDIRISYRADSVIGRNMPFDSLRAELEVKEGVVHLRPLTHGLGRGQTAGNVTLVPGPPEAACRRRPMCSSSGSTCRG